MVEKIMMDLDTEEIDTFDWVVFKIFDFFKGFYDPLDKMTSRKKYLAHVAEQITETIMGEEVIGKTSSKDKSKGRIEMNFDVL